MQVLVQCSPSTAIACVPVYRLQPRALWHNTAIVHTHITYVAMDTRTWMACNFPGCSVPLLGAKVKFGPNREVGGVRE